MELREYLKEIWSDYPETVCECIYDFLVIISWISNRFYKVDEMKVVRYGMIDNYQDIYNSISIDPNFHFTFLFQCGFPETGHSDPYDRSCFTLVGANQKEYLFTGVDGTISSSVSNRGRHMWKRYADRVGHLDKVKFVLHAKPGKKTHDMEVFINGTSYGIAFTDILSPSEFFVSLEHENDYIELLEAKVEIDAV